MLSHPATKWRRSFGSSMESDAIMANQSIHESAILYRHIQDILKIRTNIRRSSNSKVRIKADDGMKIRLAIQNSYTRLPSKAMRVCTR
jgi:hypothetical protein